MVKRLSLIFNLLIITSLAYAGVDSFYRVADTYVTAAPVNLAAPVEKAKVKNTRRRPISQYKKTIVTRDLFHTIKPEEPELDIPAPEDLEVTKLKIKLLGTIVGPPELSFAIIQDSVKKKQDLYGVGDKVAGATVKQINSGEVVIAVGGRQEVLLMEEDKDDRKSSSSRSRRSDRDYTVKRGEINDAIGNINHLMTQVNVRPHFENGKPAGLMLRRIKDGSIFKRMGLEDGDVIKGVNDEEIKDTEDVLSLYRTMKDSQAVTLQIKRKGALESINYEFE